MNFDSVSQAVMLVSAHSCWTELEEWFHNEKKQRGVSCRNITALKGFEHPKTILSYFLLQTTRRASYTYITHTVIAQSV